MTTKTTFKVLQIFAGAGGGCLGFDRAKTEYRGILADFKTIGAIDSDPGACEALEAITGCKATVMDLFTREQYTAFHGHEPPPEWREMVPADLVKATEGEAPDVIFASPPCKGLSGLLSKAKSKSAKYQALNDLVTRWLFLALEAWRSNLPSLLLLENVPRIQSRGRHLLNTAAAYLRGMGYALSETVHDCGELGGLGQTRKRFLLVARLVKTCPAYLYEPVKWPLRTIGDVIGPLPAPGDKKGGQLHTLPKLQAKTWERLAMIPAGSDWRALKPRFAAGDWRLVDAPATEIKGRTFANVVRLVDVSKGATPAPEAPAAAGEDVGDLSTPTAWRRGILGVKAEADASATVTGMARPMTGPFSVADGNVKLGQHHGKMRVEDAAGPAHTITGSDRVGSGALSVAEPVEQKGQRFNNVERLVAYGETCPAVTGGTGPSSGGLSVADPSLKTAMTPTSVTLRVRSANTPSPTVTGSSDIWDSGGFAVADDFATPKLGQHHGKMRVEGADGPAHTITGVSDIQAGALSVADPSLNIAPRNGTLGVQSWDRHSVTVTGSIDVQAGTAAIADPREVNEDQETRVIIAPDGCWHRPLTTLELAALQGFPVVARDGSGPLRLPGKSTARHRMWIGNAVPPATAQAIAEMMLATLTVSRHFGGFHLGNSGVWVREAGGLRWLEQRRPGRANVEQWAS